MIDAIAVSDSREQDLHGRHAALAPKVLTLSDRHVIGHHRIPVA
jgi:hypothetical protein